MPDSPTQEPIQTRLELVEGVLGQCHQLVTALYDRIEPRPPLSLDSELTKAAVAPSAISPKVTAIGVSAGELHARLERLLRLL